MDEPKKTPNADADPLTDEASSHDPYLAQVLAGRPDPSVERRREARSRAPDRRRAQILKDLARDEG